MTSSTATELGVTTSNEIETQVYALTPREMDKQVNKRRDAFIATGQINDIIVACFAGITQQFETGGEMYVNLHRALTEEEFDCLRYYMDKKNWFIRCNDWISRIFFGRLIIITRLLHEH